MQATGRKEGCQVSTIVLKCGGSILDQLADEFLQSIGTLCKNGHQVIIVHGGGPDINEVLQKFEIESNFVNGLRYTTKEVLEVAEWVLAGKTNRKLVEKLSQFGINAIGLHGSDTHLLQAQLINKEKLGLVGEVVNVNVSLLEMICRAGMIPVITPIGIDHEGNKLNVNADYAARSVAMAFGAEECIFVTDVDGILVNGKVQTELTEDEITSLIDTGIIYGGMIPKVNSGLALLHQGLPCVRIVNGKKAMLAQDTMVGTKLIRKAGVAK